MEGGGGKGGGVKSENYKNSELKRQVRIVDLLSWAHKDKDIPVGSEGEWGGGGRQEGGREISILVLFWWNINPELENTNVGEGGGGGLFQTEGMGLLEYQAMPSLRNLVHVLCTFSNT